MDYTWNQSYSVGNETIDDQHKKLLSLFDDASNLLQNHGSKVDTIKLISELLVYSIFHFTEEEKLMELSGYSELEAHKKSHAYFIDQVNEFKSKSISSDETLNEDIFMFLAEWIVNHIKVDDQNYKTSIKSIL